MVVAVTGATGHLGRLVVEALIERGVEANAIVATGRTPEKAEGLRRLGVQVRIADYSDAQAVRDAVNGVDRLVLVSGTDFGQRVAQNSTVIDAARAAGVSQIAYTSILGGDTTVNPVRAEHVATEAYLTRSGVPYTLLRNGWYHENYLDTARRAAASGLLIGSARGGRVASAARADYAQAAAIVVSSDGHDGKTYELSGDTAWSYPEFAAAITEATGQTVEYREADPDEQRTQLLAAGLPEAVVGYLVRLDLTTAAHALEAASGTLSRLIGRPTTPFVATLRTELG